MKILNKSSDPVEGVERMLAAELIAWRKRMAFTQEEAAHQLCVSLRGYQQWEGGERPIFGPIPLACAAISFGLRWKDLLGLPL